MWTPRIAARVAPLLSEPSFERKVLGPRREGGVERGQGVFGRRSATRLLGMGYRNVADRRPEAVGCCSRPF